MGSGDPAWGREFKQRVAVRCGEALCEGLAQPMHYGAPVHMGIVTQGHMLPPGSVLCPSILRTPS